MASLGGTPVASPLVGEYRVQVYLYDLSHGMAKSLSLGFLGKQIDGIWHTGLVTYGSEYFYGGGVQACRPGGSMAGQPGQVIDMGYSRVSPAMFHEFLQGISHRFTAATYSLLDWNCNNFTNECCLFLTGRPIPAFITGLPAEALATPFGAMLRPMLTQMEGQMRGGGGGGGGAIPWGGSQLQLPPATARPDRMVPEQSNPSTPHSIVDSAAAIAAAAINQTTPSNVPGAVAAAAPVAAAASSSAPLVSLLGRSTPAKLLTSADKKSRSFHILVKANAKKAVPGTGLTAAEDALLSEVVTALAEDGQTVKPEGVTLVDGFTRTWAPALQFPVLGLLRLLVLRPEASAHYAEVADELVASLVAFLPADSSAASSAAANVAPANAQAMALCTLANLLTHGALQRLGSSESIWTAVHATGASENLTVRLMSATLAFNACALLPKTDADVVFEAALYLAERIKVEQDAQVATRLLFALGELLLGNDALGAMLVGMEFPVEFTAALTTLRAGIFAAAAQFQHTAGEVETILKQQQAALFQVE